MKKFLQRELPAARAHAAAGGMALHVCDASLVGYGAPNCFRRSKSFAHLFDQDAERLTTWARKLGVRVIFIDRAGTADQHIDLCGKPLEYALKVAATAAEIRAALDQQGGAK